MVVFTRLGRAILRKPSIFFILVGQLNYSREVLTKMIKPPWAKSLPLRRRRCAIAARASSVGLLLLANSRLRARIWGFVTLVERGSFQSRRVNGW